MGAERERHRVLGQERLHEPCPDDARRAQLGDLHEEVHADAEEEGEARGEGVDVEPAREGRAHVLETVGEREGELLHGSRPRLLHVIAGDRDRVELRHALRRVCDHVGHDAHARDRRIDVGVADHELLEDVVLDGAGELGLGNALLLARHDEGGHHRQHGAVHGHRHAHPIERDAAEEDLHVLDGIDRHAGLAHVADDARMVGIVAAVGGQVEGDREPGLAALEVALEELVGRLGGREAAVLAHGPRAVGVHGGARPAQEGRQARHAVDRLEPLEVGRRIERLDGQALGRLPGERLGRGALELLARGSPPVLEARLGMLVHGAIILRRTRMRQRLCAGGTAVAYGRLALRDARFARSSG